MALSTAERNRRKRERKKRDREEQRKSDDEHASNADIAYEKEEIDVEIEYVPEPLQLPQDMEDFVAVREFQERSAAVITDDEHQAEESNVNNLMKLNSDDDNDDDEDETSAQLSKRKLRELLRPSIAELKQRVKRPDLVEAHDVTAANPEFLIYLKAVPGTVPVPRHWGRKRKFLQGKRGYEKPPFQLPDFIVKTGITEIRDTVAKEEESMSIRQKNRQRVAPKMGAIDVDYRTLHDAFFKHQTKPTNLTKFGDLYYEGKELESKPTNMKPGNPLSQALRDALGMSSPSIPPPWLINMQRYGPPPSWPGLPIPGLNAPLPNAECQYGFHPGGWGKPPIDAYGRPLYGGNPFDPPGSSFKSDIIDSANLVTSDGKAVTKANWGALPSGYVDEAEEAEEESSDEDMEASSSEEEEDEQEAEDDQLPEFESGPTTVGVTQNVLQSDFPTDAVVQSSGQPKQLYQVIEQRENAIDSGAVFASQVAYVLPDSQNPSAPAVAPESKAATSKKSNKRKDDDEEDDLGKNFKF